MVRRKPAPQPLSLRDPRSSTTATSSTTSNRGHDSSALSTDLETVPSAPTALSPAESRSPASATSRASPFSSRFAQKRPQTARAGQSSKPSDPEPLDQRRPSQPGVANQTQKTTTQPHITTAYDPSPRQGPSESKKSKSGFFHFNKPSKSTNHLTGHTYQHSGSSQDEVQSRGSEGPSTSKQGDSTQDAAHQDEKHSKLKPSRSELSLSSSGDHEPATTSELARRSKPKPSGILTQTKSLRDKEISSPTETPDPMPALVTQPTAQGDSPDSPPLRTAPVAHERSFRDMMDSSVRNRSEDRAPTTREEASSRENHRERDPKGSLASSREYGGSTFLSGLRNSSTRAVGMLGRSFFGKSHRSGSTHEKEHVVDDEQYEIKVLNLPLAAQARKTRISKRLEDCRDKTEFWMPAFAWRAIDYLNYKGCEVEGLYRVPGSGPQIKKWQRKFDEQYDVNLFEADDLYDINIIGSMLKAWLRELPDELFPKASQERISRECAGAETVPQLLVDELSNLSPFQYYLLFAITCHLSLLLAHSDKNKMDFRNLCICFQPCMKIDAFCFKFLVCDWRDCWKGCKNEAAYIEQEYILLDQPPPKGLTESRQQQQQQSSSEQNGDHDERQRSPSPDNSSKGSGRSSASTENQPDKPKQGQLQESESKNSFGSHDSTISTTLTITSEREPVTRTTELRRLSPIQPLSPLGFN